MARVALVALVAVVAVVVRVHPITHRRTINVILLWLLNAPAPANRLARGVHTACSACAACAARAARAPCSRIRCVVRGVKAIVKRRVPERSERNVNSY